MKNNFQKRFYDNKFKKISNNQIDFNIRNVYFNKLLNILNKEEQHLKDKKLKCLEIGCGGGEIMEMFSKKFNKFDIAGIDISKKNILDAKKRGLNVEVGDIEENNLKANEFDFVYGTAVLHHLNDLDSFFKKINLSLKPGGRILFGPEPERYNFIYMFWHLLRGSWKAEKNQLNITKGKIRDILKKNGYKSISVYRYGNAFAYGYKFIGKIYDLLLISKLFIINDIYIYAEK